MKLRWLLFFLLMTACVGAAFWPGSGRNFVTVEVSEGQSARDVIAQLQEKRVLGNALPFRFWVRVRNAGAKIHIGRYRVSTGRSSYWIVDDLIQGRTEKARIVIPEGFASWQIAERLDEAGLCDASLFKEVVAKKKLEGFLFPATYELSYGMSADAVVRAFVNTFEENWTSEFEARTKQRGFTKLQVVTLASIVEREVRHREELPLVSAVYNNRLQKNMPLQADPTVQFAQGYWKSRLTYADYRNTISPYNTYLHSGLPPGPICNPGRDAIAAALWPAESRALFFVAKDDGYHSFSEDYRQHTNKVNQRNKANRAKKSAR